MTEVLPRGLPVASARSAQRQAHRRIRANLPAALLFLAPAAAALLILRVVPAGIALWQSFFHRSLLAGGSVFVGLRNYTDLFTDPGFLGALRVTVLFSLIINPVQIAASFALAVLYTRRFAGTSLWRSLVILPVAAPAAVATVIWSVIYRADGLANALLRAVGIPPQPFVSSSGQALLSIIVLLSWTGVGYWMLFLIAGINDIPTSYYEAASLDGATAWRQIWGITLPLVRRPLAFVLIADTVANFLVFAPAQILTQGGPNGSTNLLMYDIYSRAYTAGDVNTAYAEVVLLVLLTLGIVAVQFRLLSADQ